MVKLVSIHESIMQIETLRKKVSQLNTSLINEKLQESIIDSNEKLAQLPDIINKRLSEMNWTIENNMSDFSQRIQFSQENLLKALERFTPNIEIDTKTIQQAFDKINETIKNIEPMLEEKEKQAIQQTTNNYYVALNEPQSDSSRMAVWMNLFAIISFLVTFMYQIYRDVQDDIEKDQDQVIQQQQFEILINKANELIESAQPVVSESPVLKSVQDQHISE